MEVDNSIADSELICDDGDQETLDCFGEYVSLCCNFTLAKSAGSETKRNQRVIAARHSCHSFAISHSNPPFNLCLQKTN